MRVSLWRRLSASRSRIMDQSRTSIAPSRSSGKGQRSFKHRSTGLPTWAKVNSFSSENNGRLKIPRHPKLVVIMLEINCKASQGGRSHGVRWAKFQVKDDRFVEILRANATVQLLAMSSHCAARQQKVKSTFCQWIYAGQLKHGWHWGRRTEKETTWTGSA
ncbi:hypothetical protein OG21DRAFT_847911 [Imleria badia]|nr:hypothetical protein OG21DRAFT_847911 [Imleria badia]